MKTKQPADNYDPLWVEYWQQNPQMLRSVGAAAAEEEGTEAGAEEEGAGEGAEEGAEDSTNSPKEGSDHEGATADDVNNNTDWRDAIKDEKLRDHAGRFTTLDDLVKANLDSRQKLSKAIVPPGKSASDDDVAAYRKAIGVPESPEGYEFPDLPEGQEVTDDVKQSREAWAKRFHEANVPAETAKALVEAFNEEAQAALKAQVDADKKYAEEQAELLQKEWGADAEKNRAYANRAFAKLAERAGVDVEELKHIETKAGQYLMDDARLSRIFAVIGREMGEGSLGGAISESEREAAETELDEIRSQIREAQSKGDNRKANKLYQKEQELIGRIHGNQPTVGAMGRVA